MPTRSYSRLLPIFVACLFMSQLSSASGQVGAPPSNSLLLRVEQQTDISSLGYTFVTGAAYDDTDNRLWIASGSAENQIAEIDPLTGTIFGMFDAGVIPGFSLGADAIAIDPTTDNMALFSIFGEDEAGLVTQGGTLVSEHTFYRGNPGGAAFDNNGILYAADASGNNISVLDPNTGALTDLITIQGGTGNLGAADFNPATGNLFVFDSDAVAMLELGISGSTARILGSTDLSGLVTDPAGAGFAFNGDGTRIFFESGASDGQLTVLQVVPEPSGFVFLALSAIALGTRRKRA